MCDSRLTADLPDLGVRLIDFHVDHPRLVRVGQVPIVKAVANALQAR